MLTVSDVSDFIQFEIWDIPGQFKLGDIDAVATFSCTGTLIFIIDSQVVPLFRCNLTHLLCMIYACMCQCSDVVACIYGRIGSLEQFPEVHFFGTMP